MNVKHLMAVERMTCLLAAALLLGFQMLSIGLLAALINAYHGRDAQTYSVAETTFSDRAVAGNAAGNAP